MSDTLALKKFYCDIVRSLEYALEKNLKSSVRAEIEKFKQVEKISDRKNNRKFSISEHAEAMVMSMLSGQTEWRKIELNKARLKAAFGNFDAGYLVSANPEDFVSVVKECKCGTTSTRKQMGSIAHNIKVLQSVPNFYPEFNDVDDFLGKTPALVAASVLNGSKGSHMKLKQMGIPLISEYMRNCGIDMAKPDRHIKRLLGESHFGEFLGNSIDMDDMNESAKELGVKNYGKASKDERAVITITALAKHLDSAVYKGQTATATEVDNVLWMYCANKYGEICLKNKPRCEKCHARDNCRTASGAISSP